MFVRKKAKRLTRLASTRRLCFEECESRRLLSVADGEFCVPESSAERLSSIALAVLNYESAYRYFPTDAIYSEAGQPLLSWRVSILPYIGQSALYEQFALDEPWDSPDNLALVDQMPELYVSPSQPTLQGETVFQVISGEGTAFPDPIPRNRCSAPGGCGLRIGDVEDGLSNSALVVEVASDQAIPWTRPGDLAFDESNPLSGLSENDFRFALGTSEVVEVDGPMSPSLWSKLVTVADGEFVNVGDVADALEPTESLRTLSLAILNYESATRRFPVHAQYSGDGQPLLSWRVAILPYIEQSSLYNEFRHDEPWDSPHNIQLVDKMPRVFASDDLNAGTTNYLALVGEDTIFPLEATDRGLKLSEIEDGLSQTLLLVEASPDHAVEWTKPADIAFNLTDPLGGIGEGDFGVAMADGRVFQLPSDVDAELFRSAAIVNDHSALPTDRLPGDVNLDGRVDAADATVILENQFEISPLAYGWTTGDLNGDRVVDGSDLNIWLDNRIVPEPASPDRDRLRVGVSRVANDHRRHGAAVGAEHAHHDVSHNPVDEYFSVLGHRKGRLLYRRLR